jgi:hypothetical protein
MEKAGAQWVLLTSAQFDSETQQATDIRAYPSCSTDAESTSMRYNNKSAYIPTLRLGVCVTRDPAPIPECLGVPGTITFAFDPEAVFTANASSAACLAVL